MEVKKPLELRPSKSSREIRAAWVRAGCKESVTDFISRQEIPPVLVVPFVKKGPICPAPDIVVNAIDKIYSKVEYVPVIREFGREANSGRFDRFEPPKVVIPRRKLRDFVPRDGVASRSWGPLSLLIAGRYTNSPPKPGEKKYWYFYRREGVYTLSIHHPLDGDSRYSTDYIPFQV